MFRVTTRCLLLALAAASTGCSFISTTTDTTSDMVYSITDGISSTTPSSAAVEFVNARFDALRAEAARGEGENLDSLAALLGERDRAVFAGFMKDHYAALFANLDEPRGLLARIEAERRG